MSVLRIAFMALITSTTISCANLNSIYRDFSVHDGNGALIDIKQRAILADSRTETGKDGQQFQHTIVCAEPSPDALSAYAAELAGQSDAVAKKTLQLALGSQENSAFVGLRTQSIQLLRDALYRLCEGYMSGALDRPQYQILMRRYQKYMVALLGIEQLTGTVRAPAVTINTSSKSETGTSAEANSDQVEESDNDTTAEDDADQEGVLTTANHSAKITTSGGGTGTVVNITSAGGPNDVDRNHIANVVKEIVNNVVKTSDTGELCFAYFYDKNGATDQLSTWCKEYLDNLNKIVTLKLKAADTRIDIIKRSPVGNGDPDRVLRDITTEDGYGDIGIKSFDPNR